MQGQYSMRSPAVKRLMKEAQELKNPTELYHAQPLEDNLFEWHFTLRGPEDSDFDGGIYHGRIILPPEYPMKPPSIILLTPNGRFEIFKKICLSISGHHPESWQPSWSIRTALLAIIGFMPTHGGGAIGSLDYTPEERKVLAKKSQDWKCPDCGDVSQKLKPKTEASDKAAQEAKELASQINFQGEKTGGSDAKSSEETTTTASSTPDQSSTPSVTPTQSPTLPLHFSYPWTMLPPQPNPGAPAGPVMFPRFPYPPSMMFPRPGMFMTSPPHSEGFGGFPPMPFFPLGMQGFAPFPGAATVSQTVGTSAAVLKATSPPASSAVSTGTTAMCSCAASTTTSSSPTATKPKAAVPSSGAAEQSTSTATTSSSPTAAKPKAPVPSSGAAEQSTSTATTSSSPTATKPKASSDAAEQSTTTTTSKTVPPPDLLKEKLDDSASTQTDPKNAAATGSTSNALPQPAEDSATTAATVASLSASSASGAQLRQRSTATNQSQQAPPAEMPSPTQILYGSYSQGTFLVMLALTLAITFLLGRRVFLYYFQSDLKDY